AAGHEAATQRWVYTEGAIGRVKRRRPGCLETRSAAALPCVEGPDHGQDRPGFRQVRRPGDRLLQKLAALFVRRPGARDAAGFQVKVVGDGIDFPASGAGRKDELERPGDSLRDLVLQ